MVENAPGFFALFSLQITPRPAIEYPDSIGIWHFGHFISSQLISDSFNFSTLLPLTGFRMIIQNTPMTISAKNMGKKTKYEISMFYSSDA